MSAKICGHRVAAVVLFFLLMSCLTAPTATADREAILIRVLLGQGLGQVDFQVEQGQYLLVDGQNGQEIGRATPGVSWIVKKEGNNLRVLQEGVLLPGTFNGPLRLRAEDTSTQSLFRCQGIRCRGSLDIVKETNGLAAINALDLEHYLYGVVAQEMGTTAAPEALKAQAIVSRSYTLATLVEAKPGWLYDVSADTSNQAYRGYEPEAIPGGEQVRQAVDATRGQVIFYDDQIIKAFYHANSGGHTEDSENVWGTSLPYLHGVPSPEDVWALEYPRQSPAGWPAYNYIWSVAFTRQQLQEKVNNWLAGQGKGAVGNIIDLAVSRGRKEGQGETVSGRVTELNIYTDKGQVSISNNNIRSALGLQSTLFTVQMQTAVNILDGSGQQRQVSSAGNLVALGAAGISGAPNGTKGDYTVAGSNGSRTVAKSSDQVVFQGRGNGHGLGMSQWGAMGMAVKGYTYQEIIEHYYNRGLADGRLKIALYRK